MVVLRQEGIVYAWHAPTGTHSFSFQAELTALNETIQWISSILSWDLAMIMYECKSLVHDVSNANSAERSVNQLQASAVIRAMSKSIMIVWAPGHCGLSGSELAEHQANLGATETQLDNALEQATRRAHILHSCRPLQSKTNSRRRCTSLSLMSISKHHLPRMNTPTLHASVVVITLLNDADCIWWQCPKPIVC